MQSATVYAPCRRPVASATAVVWHQVRAFAWACSKK